MCAFVQLTPAKVITQKDAKQFFGALKANSMEAALLRDYTRKVAATNEVYKNLSLVQLDDAAGKIFAHRTQYSFTNLDFDNAPRVSGGTSLPPKSPWQLQVAKRINPPFMTALHIVEGLAEFVAGVAAGIGAFLINSPAVAGALAASSIVSISYGIANPIKKISATRGENLERLASAIETAINEALKSVASKQEKQS